MTDEQKGRDREANRLGGRVRRYARVTGVGAGIAARVARDRMLGRSSSEAGGVLLKAALGSLKGPVMKVAQILATVPGMLPDEMAQELSELQANAPAMGWSFVRRRMKSELGPDWQNCFKSFERDAVRAASLGQVHKAISLDDRELAVKLQYPDMRSTVEADLSQLDLFLRVFKEMDGSLDTAELREEVADRLREELDYRLEAKHLKLFKTMLKGQDNLYIPEVLDDLSTDRLLVMTWLEGKKFNAYLDRPLEERSLIARRLFKTWYIPFHQYGIIHGDPHPGNYTVRDDLGLNLLDFGCIRVFHPKFVGGVIQLYEALKAGNEEMAVAAYESWGFENLSKELIAVLNQWAEFLYGPLMDDRVRPIDLGEKPGQHGKEVAIKVRKELQRLGPVKPPREFVFMDRAAVGMGSVFTHLGAELNWHQLFEEIIDGVSLESVQKAQKKAMVSSGLEDRIPS